MTTNHNTEHEGTTLETEIWLPLKEASAKANRCDATIKRAITGGKLVGRKVSASHNASFEVSKTSFDAWLATQAKPKSEISVQTCPQQKAAVAASTADVPEKKQLMLSKADRRKLKAARNKEIPESARRLRRWKNFMRHASQEQALAMIKWLSARLAPKKSLSKKILREALKQEKSHISLSN